MRYFEFSHGPKPVAQVLVLKREIILRERAERWHVRLPAILQSVEAARHEMPPSVFHREPTLVHGVSRRLRQQGMTDFS